MFHREPTSNPQRNVNKLRDEFGEQIAARNTNLLCAMGTKCYTCVEEEK